MYIMMQDIIPSLSQSISLTSFLSLAPFTTINHVNIRNVCYSSFLSNGFITIGYFFPSSFHIAYMHINRYRWLVYFVDIQLCLQIFFISIFIFHIYSINEFIGVCSRRHCFFILVIDFISKTTWYYFSYAWFLIPFVLPVYIVIGIIDIFSDLREKLLYNKHNRQGGYNDKKNDTD